jgi:hypothetical protein
MNKLITILTNLINKLADYFNTKGNRLWSDKPNQQITLSTQFLNKKFDYQYNKENAFNEHLNKKALTTHFVMFHAIHKANDIIGGGFQAIDASRRNPTTIKVRYKLMNQPTPTHEVWLKLMNTKPLTWKQL